MNKFLFIFKTTLVLTGLAFPFTTQNLMASDSKHAKTEEAAWALLSKVPIQSAGRIKPLQSFAQDSILTIYERRSPRGELTGDQPLKIIFKWLSSGSTWSKKELLYIGNSQARDLLSLDPKRTLYTPIELSQSVGAKKASELISQKQADQEKLTNPEQAAMRSLNNISLFQGIATGTAWTIIPHGESWLSLADENANKTGIPQLVAAILDNLLPDEGHG